MIFWLWVTDSFLESILLCILPYYLMIYYDYQDGMQATYMEAAQTCFTAVVIISNLKVISGCYY